MVACPGLTELTVICPSSIDAQVTRTTVPLDPVESVRSAISELVIACKALPDLDTLQIVYFPVFPPSMICACNSVWCNIHRPSTEERQALRDYMKGVKDWVIDCLKRPETGCQRRKKITLRVIKLTRDPLRPLLYRGSAKVEEYEVYGPDSPSVKSRKVYYA